MNSRKTKHDIVLFKWKSPYFIQNIKLVVSVTDILYCRERAVF